MAARAKHVSHLSGSYAFFLKRFCWWHFSPAKESNSVSSLIHLDPVNTVVSRSSRSTSSRCRCLPRWHLAPWPCPARATLPTCALLTFLKKGLQKLNKRCIQAHPERSHSHTSYHGGSHLPCRRVQLCVYRMFDHPGHRASFCKTLPQELIPSNKTYKKWLLNMVSGHHCWDAALSGVVVAFHRFCCVGFIHIFFPRVLYSSSPTVSEICSLGALHRP